MVMKRSRVFSLAKAVTLTFSVSLLTLVTPLSGEAQRVNTIKPTTPDKVTLTGVIRDPDGRALAAAEVIVDSENRAVSNSRGEFTIAGLPAGIVEFTARRIGYQPTTTAIDIQPGLTVHLGIKLVPAAVQLGTMVIEGKAVDKTLWQTGFYQRQNAGMGDYFDSEYMRRHQAGLGALMGNVAGVRVDRGTGDRGGPVATGPRPDGSRCALNVFVDGNIIPWSATTGIDDVVNRDDVLAVEVYPRASEMPAKIAGRGGATGVGAIGTVSLQGASRQLGGGFSECGAVLIWTKPLEGRKR